MKKTLLTTACGLSLLALTLPAAAEVSLSANVALTTDYVWRGVTQNMEEPAIQGGFDAGLDNGLYAGIWGSNVSTGEGSLEIDYYGGWSTELSNGVGLDLGILAYTFPGTTNWDTEEYYLGVSYSNFGLMASYSNDLDAIYWDASADFELPGEFGLGFHYGYWSYDVGTDVADWKVAISRSIVGLDVELAYTDTDIPNAKDVADGRVFLTVSKSWE